MRRFIAAIVVGASLLSGLGCMGKAEYVQKNKDGGIIALKIDADEAEARKLMEKHLGSNYEVVEKYDPKLRQATGLDLQPGSKLSKFAAPDNDVMHIAYRKLPDSQFGGKTPTGLPPAPKDGGLMQTSQQTRLPKPIATGGPQTEFGSDPVTVQPPALFGGQ